MKPEIPLMINEGLVKQFKSFESRGMTGIVEVSECSVSAAVFFEDGHIIHAWHGRTIGKKALYRIFAEKNAIFRFQPQSVYVNRSIHGSMEDLLEDGNREVDALNKINSNSFDNIVTINLKMIEMLPDIREHSGLKYILSLVYQYSRIKDIIDASQMTDFQTYKNLAYMVKAEVLKIEPKALANIRLITDADLPADFVQDRNIIVVPVSAQIDGEVFSEITPENFYNRLEKSKEFPKVISVSVEKFHEIFGSVIPESDIIALFQSKKLIDTFENGLAAKGKYYNEYMNLRYQRRMNENIQINIIDSRLASLGTGLLVAEASDKIAAGWDIAKIQDHIESLIPSARMFVISETTAYLRLCGQTGLMDEVLHIKPILSMVNGSISVIDRVRKWETAYQLIIEWMKRSIEDTSKIRVGIMDAGSPDKAAQMKSLIENRLNCRQIMMSHIGASVGSYCGIGAVAVAYFSTR